MHTRKGSIQGYNAQAVTTCEQVIVAAELTQDANDLQQLQPMLEATAATLAAAGIPQRPGTLLADAGYWTIAKLQSDHGKVRYAKRKQTVEPVFGQVKDVRGARRFQRRGLRACQAEWKLLCGTHNLLKLWRHQTAWPPGTPATT